MSLCQKRTGGGGGHRSGWEGKDTFSCRGQGRQGESVLRVPNDPSFPQAAEVTAMGLCRLQGKAGAGDWTFSKKTDFYFISRCNSPASK